MMFLRTTHYKIRSIARGDNASDNEIGLFLIKVYCRRRSTVASDDMYGKCTRGVHGVDSVQVEWQL